MTLCTRMAIALCIALAPGPVHASPGLAHPQATTATEAEARRAFEAGRAFYDEGRYREAIERFEAGYALTERPIFLLNIGQAYRQLFEPERARESYVAFLARAPADDPARAEVAALVREIDVLLAARVVSPVVVSAPPPQKPFVRRHWWIFPVTALVATGAAVGIYFAVRPPGRPTCGDAKFGCLDAMP